MQVFLEKLDLQVVYSGAQYVCSDEAWPDDVEAHEHELHSDVGLLVTLEEGATFGDEEELANHHESH